MLYRIKEISHFGEDLKAGFIALFQVTVIGQRRRFLYVYLSNRPACTLLDASWELYYVLVESVIGRFDFVAVVITEALKNCHVSSQIYSLRKLRH